MAVPVRRVAKAVALILAAASPLLIHHIAFGAEPAWMAGALAALQIAVILTLVGGHWSVARGVSLGAAAVLIGAGALFAPALPARVLSVAVSGLCHATAYASLLAWFAGSLRPGREPVITGFARRVRRTMPDRVVRYTRRVTMAWCGFFALQLAMSALLLAFAPQAVWSMFVNLLNLPLIAAMMLGEFACRWVLFRNEPHTSLATTLRSLKSMRAPTARGVSGGPA
jgi:uncharacterized membrane protein